MLKTKSKKYIYSFAATLCVLLTLVFGSSYIIMVAVGEHLSIDQVVRYQQKHSTEDELCLFGTALTAVSHSYKLKLHEVIKPDVLILGSSRVLQFRPEFFSTTMVNAGKGMGSLVSGYHFLKESLKLHRPSHVIIGLDFWWFNEAFDKVENINYIPDHVLNPTKRLNNYLLPLKWAYDGNIELDKLTEYTSNCHFGAMASANYDGYGPRGSYFYSSLVYGLQKNQTTGFEDSLERIRVGNRRFQFGHEFSKGHFQNFLKLTELLKTEKIPYTIILLPIVSEVYQAMKARGEYEYIWNLEKVLTERHQVLNYHDPDIISAQSCEFIDGFHGGDVVFSRLLEDMARKNPVLAQYLDLKVLNRTRQREGFAYSGLHEIVPNGKEVDFLNIGCKKEPAALSLQ